MNKNCANCAHVESPAGEGVCASCDIGYSRWTQIVAATLTAPTTTEPTATWWARRWYDSASPAEHDAMREIMNEGN